MAEIKHEIVLTTTDPNNEVGLIKIRQADENTQILDTLITENGVPKSYEGLQAFFCAKLGQSDGLGIIEQKLTSAEMTNPSEGKLEYKMRDEDWQVLGRQTGYFSFRKLNVKGTYTEQFSTRNFYFNIVPNIFSKGVREVKSDGSTYIWTIEDLIRLFNEYIATGKTDWEDFVEQNRDIIESVDPGGVVLSELIDSRKPIDSNSYNSLKERLDNESSAGTIEASSIQMKDEETTTNYFLTTIPHSQNLIMKQAYLKDSYRRTARETFNYIEGAAVVINAGMSTGGTIDNVMGAYIVDGEVVHTGHYSRANWILAWDNQNNWNYYENKEGVDQQIINDGFNNAFTACTPIIWDGEILEEGVDAYKTVYPSSTPYPMQILTQKIDGTIQIFTCDGRNIVGSLGWTIEDAIRVLQQFDVMKAFVMDGGGSCQTVVKGVQVNHNHDESGKKERKLWHYLYFEKNEKRTKLQKSSLLIGESAGFVEKKVLDLEVDFYKLKNTQLTGEYISEGTNLFTLPPGLYEGKDVFGAPESNAIYLYEIVWLPDTSRKVITATSTTASPKKFIRTTIRDDATSQSAGWIQIHPRNNNLYAGAFRSDSSSTSLTTSIFDYTYVEIEYGFYTTGYRDICKLRTKLPNEVKVNDFSIRKSHVNKDTFVSYNSIFNVSISSDGRTMTPIKETVVVRPLTGDAYVRNEKDITIYRIDGIVEVSSKKGYGE